MRSGTRHSLVFLAGCLMTAAVWCAFWPARRPQAPAPAGPPPAAAGASWDKQKLAAAIAALESARSNREKLDAVIELAEIPSRDIPRALDGIELKEGRNLSMAAKTLLIRWASTDGKAAMEWAWLHFRLDSQWSDAFRQIGPAWAWRDPQGMSRWVADNLDGKPPSHNEANMEQAGASEKPILSFGDMTRICSWLLAEDPLAAYTTFLKRGGFSTGDSFMWTSLNDPQEIRKALLAFDNIEVLKTRDVTKPFTPGSEMYAESLMSRWLEIDPDGFQKSSYAAYMPRRLKSRSLSSDIEEWKALPPEGRAEAANRLIQRPDAAFQGSAGLITREWLAADPDGCREWLESLPPEQMKQAAAAYLADQASAHLDEALDWIGRFDPEQSAAYFINAFDAWNAAGSKTAPDMSDWSEERKQAWEDLAALEALATSSARPRP